MDGSGEQGSTATSGLDVGAVPGSPVVSPVDGKVVAVKQYRILGRYVDVEIDIQLADDPSLLLVVTHVARVEVGLGDDVAARQDAARASCADSPRRSTRRSASTRRTPATTCSSWSCA